MTAKISQTIHSLLKWLLPVVIVSSCSRYINYIDDQARTYEILPTKSIQLNCEIKSPIEVISSNEQFNLVFAPYIRKISTKNQLQFIDKAAIMLLLQMYFRPDLSSPSARLQLFISLRNQERYWDFHINETPVDHQADTIPTTYLPYLFGVETLLREYHSKYNLKILANIIETSFDDEIIIGGSFERFLLDSRNTLKNFDVFTGHFFRIKQLLRKNESIDKLPLLKVVDLYLKHKNSKDAFSRMYRFSNELFPYSYMGQNIQCNHPLDKYDRQNFQIDPSDTAVSNNFGLFETKNNSFFMAASSQNLETFLPLQKTAFIQGTPQLYPKAFCKISNNRSHIFLFSTKGKDPMQFIHNLIKDQRLNKASSTNEIVSIVNDTRILQLLSPRRLIIETQNIKAVDVNKLPDRELPLYGANSLGEIWGTIHLDGKETVFFDKRNKLFLGCIDEQLATQR